MQFDKQRHVLLADEAHKGRLHTPEELAEYERRVREAGVELFPVQVPDWPPVKKSPLMLVFGDSDPWKNAYWTGEQLAADKAAKSTRVRHKFPSLTIFYDSDHVMGLIAREMCGDTFQPHRMAYQWQVPIFNPSTHLNIRQWCAENEVDLPDFYRQFLPKVTQSAGREVIFEVANPNAAQERDSRGSWAPTVRVIHVRDRQILEQFLGQTERYTYSADQPVTWQRALDDSRWEARRQVAPQRERWMTHRSWINRVIGDGAWTEADRDPGNGHAFGPFMELYDDGLIHLWVYGRALPFLEANPLNIHGVLVPFEVDEKVHISVYRMRARIDETDMEQILSRKIERAEPAKAPDSSGDPGERPEVRAGFVNRGPFYRHSAGVLPPQFHRPAGRPALVLKRGVVRGWGQVAGEWVINGETIDLQPWAGQKDNAHRAKVDPAVTDRILANQPRKETPHLDPKTEERVLHEEIRQGVVVYRPGEVVQALRDVLGRDFRFFGNQTSDSRVLALTPQGLKAFLRSDPVNRQTYVLDEGGRNYDCDNFAESLRCALISKHGINGVGVVWGDVHAWNVFVLAGPDGPMIRFIEPQTDQEVEELEHQFSIERRCEILL